MSKFYNTKKNQQSYDTVFDKQSDRKYLIESISKFLLRTLNDAMGKSLLTIRFVEDFFPNLITHCSKEDFNFDENPDAYSEYLNYSRSV